MKAIKKARKTFNKATKKIGLNCIERRRVKKFAKNLAYDTAVNVASTICVDAVYTVADMVVAGATMAYGKAKELIAKPVTARVAIVTTTGPVADESEENEA